MATARVELLTNATREPTGTVTGDPFMPLAVIVIVAAGGVVLPPSPPPLGDDGELLPPLQAPTVRVIAAAPAA
jgi:hypothetical protein